MSNEKLDLIGKIEMHEFSANDDNFDERTGKMEDFNVYLFTENLPLFLFQTGDNIEDENNCIIAGMTHFMFSQDIHKANDSDFISAGSITKQIGDKWFTYKATAKTWRLILSKASQKYGI